MRRIAFVCVLSCVWLCAAAHAQAQDRPDSNEPVVFEANELGYDQKNGIVVALGDVEIVQGATIMRADKLVYYQALDVVRATGNVSLLQPAGDVVFADSIELRDNLKQGVVREFSARLADDSVVAARAARRLNHYQVELENAVYSPCELCPGKSPFWQLKAGKVELDDLNQQMRYEDASMEFMGIPVFYAPYLTHPTPDAEASSGFLVPSYSQGSLLGTTVRVPYYWRIDHNQEAIIAPWYSSEDGALLEGTYDVLLDHGEFRFEGSGTNPERRNDTGSKIGGNEFRGHVFAKGHYNLGEHWQVGTDINHASDDTYLRRYGFGAQNVLFSRGYLEGADGRNFATFQGLHIQGLRLTDDPDTTPLVLPSLQAFYQTDPVFHRLRLHAGLDTQYLTRDIGTDQTRISGSVGASLPLISEGGQVFTFTANVRNDYYDLTSVRTAAQPQPFDTNETRTIPQMAMEWRYPLMRQFEDSSLTIEPMVLAVAQPNGNNPPEITNEDNRLTELNDTNLFAIDRFPGLDTVDSGSRVAYGMRGEYLMANGDILEGLIGQNFNSDADSPFPNSNEAGESLSDVIGRIFLRSGPFSTGYRFAFDPKDFTANRNELEASARYRGYYIRANYASLERNAFVNTSEELALDAGLPFYAGWSLQGSMLRDLELSQMVTNQLGLLYSNECFNLLLNWRRSFTRDRDVEPNTTVSLRVGFKNLGEFGGE